jgi:serine/threonine protein kinase
MDVSFMVLELASASLADVLAQRQQIPWLDRLRLFRDVVKGAHQMHVQRILHRDIKSDNVLLFETRPPLAKLSDLGRSKDTRQSPRVVPNQYEAGRGDPSFLPPEMLWLQGASDAHSYLRADLYLLGSVLFELASGVGLTAFALGNPRVIIAQALRLDPAARDQEFQNRIPDLRSQMELAYDAFRQELPNSIKHEATMLLRQLTNPDPVLRQPVRPFQNLPPVWDLQWLLRRIDILVLRLETALRDTTTVRRRRSRT